MRGPKERVYRSAEFAARAGVTPRALRHYDRLGLLKPKRSSAGYRLYTDRDLATLAEVVALKFIGLPLKQIAALARQPRRSLVDVLAAQRVVLEAKRLRLTRAIDVVHRSEAALRSGAVVDAGFFRHIIEVMEMDTNHEETIAMYSQMLKSKIAHLASMSPEQRDQLRVAWSGLVTDIKAAAEYGEPPDSPRAQTLLARWTTLFQAATGASAETAEQHAGETPFRATPELRDALWDRRAEWMPAGAQADGSATVSAEQARAIAERLRQSAMSSDVVEFIRRARAAKT